ncbi:phenylacetate--CoA ligase family protein [Candidatus Methylocalor cossyra]|uniref:Phenylacetate-CoA ligase n=1 Tax=Candidatus Methylocalor cossyra TaxID=3108543 RepID=A0ABP1C711_9GAMM
MGNPITPDSLIDRFFSASLEELLEERLAADPEAGILRLFQRTAESVPAYRKFLAERGIDPGTITTLAAFQKLPLTTKSNYVHAFPLPERCPDGRLWDCDRVAVSSGSTGQPTFWPRGLRHELEVALRFEQLFKDSFRAHERSTLAVVAFALGNWVGGMYTTSCLWHLARKGYPLLVATPGNKPEEIFRVIRELAPHFQQTVLLGYPPFLKDVIDAGLAEGIPWHRFRVKTVFAGEVFSEEWRALVGRRLGGGSPCYDSASLYGTADGGVLGIETPLSIAIRRFFADHPNAARQLFGETRLPTLVQYDPSSCYFETHEDTLVFSGDRGLPLIRYHIADQGGLVGYEQMRAFLAEAGAPSLANYGLDETRPVPPFPFVYVFGRADFTVSFYGANIYPENIAVGLEQPQIMEWVTGKFVLEAKETSDGDKYLNVTVELLPGIAPDSEKSLIIAESIRLQLLRLNSEFANYTPTDKQLPWVSLRSFGDPEFFPSGVKHRYTR